MSLANTLKVLSGGFRTAWFMPLDSNGYFAGATGSLVAGGSTGQAGYLITGVKTAPYKAIEPLVLLGTGEDQPQGQIIEPPQTLPSFDITGSIGDLTLDALAQTTNAFNIGNASFGVIQPYLPNYIDGALLLMRLSISKDNLTSGSSNWDGVLFPKVKLVPMSSDGMSEKKITDFKYHVICNPSTIFPTGLQVSSSNFGTVSGVEFPFTTPNKIMMFGWQGDGVTTTFNLPQSAIPSTGLLAPGYPNVTYKGVPGSASTVVTASVALVSTNYQFTVSPAPSASQKLITQVEYL